MAASEDLESQRKGVVFLVWPGNFANVRKIPNQRDRALHTKCNDAAPIRVAAVHFCFPNEPFFHLLRSIMAMTMSLTYRLRLKFHVGESKCYCVRFWAKSKCPPMRFVAFDFGLRIPLFSCVLGEIDYRLIFLIQISLSLISTLIQENVWNSNIF